MTSKLTMDLALVSGRKPLRALADVTINWEEELLTVRRCAVFQKPGEPPWAKLPQIPIEKNGKKQYVALIDLSRDLKRRVLEMILDEYRKKVNESQL